MRRIHVLHIFYEDLKNGKSIVITFPEAGKILLRQFIVVGLSDVDPSVNQKKRKMLM